MAWEETDNEIRHRVRDPGDFIADSFRYKEIADGINLVLGKLKNGNGSMTTQAIRFDKAKWDMEKAKMWLEKHKDQFSQFSMPALHELKGVEIFATGQWNGDKYTENDLENMIHAFNETKDKFRPPLKLGHSEEQTLLQRDGLPAAGWIANLYRKGKKLLADFVEIPEKVYDLLKAGAYKKVSSEIYWNATVETEKYPRLLGAVALLGADLPAVTTLSDIFQMYAANAGELRAYKLDINTLKGNEMDTDIEKLQSELKDLQKKIVSSETELKSKNDIIDGANKKIETLSKKLFELEVEKEIATIVSQKDITPAMVPFLRELLMDDKREYSVKIGKEEKTFSKTALLQEMLKLHRASLSTVNDKENSMDIRPDNVNADSQKALHEKIQSYAKEHNLSYSQAYKLILRKTDQNDQIDA